MDTFELVQNSTDLMSDLKSISNSANDYHGLKIPNSIGLQVEGLSNPKSLELLFSPVIDSIVDKMLDVFASGDYTKVLDTLNKLTSVFADGGIGRGIFDGEVSQRIIQSVRNSTNSTKYLRTSSKIKKALLITKNLKRQMEHIPNPETRKKYDDAVYALTAMTKMLNSLYKNRKYLNDRVLKGLKNFMFESKDNSNDYITVEKIEA